MKRTYQSWISKVVSSLPPNASAKELVQLWYDNTERTMSIKQMSLDLLEAMIKKWKK